MERRVFGRREFPASEGRTIVCELRKDGLHVRYKRKRTDRGTHLTPEMLERFALKQFEMFTSGEMNPHDTRRTTGRTGKTTGELHGAGAGPQPTDEGGAPVTTGAEGGSAPSH